MGDWATANLDPWKKLLSLIEFFVQVRSKITQSKQKFYNPLIGL